MADSAELLISGSNVLRFAGPIFFLGLQGSSVKTALQIIEEKSVGSLSPLPFASLFANCLLWTLYGLLKKDNTVLVPNGLGILSGGFCFASYRFFAVKKDLEINAGVLVLGLLAVMIYLNQNAELLGLIGCGVAVLLMGSPLATLSTVIRDKSTASMPFVTSLMSWGNALCWSLYGLLVAKDKLIYIPNLLGFALTSVQMLLFWIYGVGKAVHSPVVRGNAKGVLF